MSKQRIQFEASEDTLKLIDELMQTTDSATRKEFFNNAVSLMKWAIDKAVDGYMIAAVSKDDNVYLELQMPALMNAAAKGKGAMASKAEEEHMTAGAAQ